AENQPSNIDLSGKTLYLTGTVHKPNLAATTPFVIDTAFTWGGFISLDRPTPVSNDQIQISIIRDFSRLFEDIDFAAISSTELEKSVLRNLINYAYVATQQ
ncbi:MAG: hypothetical protein AAF438_20375, partial [Pseudomonadota bacterium]